MSDITIRAEGLTKTRGTRRVLDAVHLTLERGRVTAILGPSGAGKSTLLRTIAGLEDLDSGTIEASGKLLTDGQILMRAEDRNIGMVFQDFSLFPHLGVLDNVMFGLRSGTTQDRKQRTIEMLEQVYLADRASDYPHALSGGEQQRVALARALAPAPTTVLLDEAFSGLDSKLRAELRDTALAAIASQGAATLMVTHDPQEAMYMADTLALMIDGTIVQSGSPSELYINPASADAARLMGEVNELDGRVSGGEVHTTFGALKIDPAPDEGRVIVLVRPESIAIMADSDGEFLVQDVRPLGSSNSVIVEASNGERCLVKSPVQSTIAVGTNVSVELGVVKLNVPD